MATGKACCALPVLCEYTTSRKRDRVVASATDKMMAA